MNAHLIGEYCVAPLTFSDVSGINDVLSKVVGSTNPLNVVMAVVDGLLMLRMPEEVARARGKEISELDLPRSYFD